MSKIRYHLNPEKFATIKTESINRNFYDLNADAFDLTSRCLDGPTNQSESRDQGEAVAVTPNGIVPLLVSDGSAQSAVIESVGQTTDVKGQSAISRADLAISSLGDSPDSEPVKVETAEPNQADAVAAPLVSESIETSIAISTAAEAETPSQSSFLKPEVTLSAGEKTTARKNRRKSGAQTAKKVASKST